MSQSRLAVPDFLRWEGEFPYRVLARYGVTTESTTQQVLDCSYDITPEEMSSRAVNDAWESLRISRSRLLLDFCCCDLPEPASPEPLGADESLPLPWPALQALAEWVPEASALEAPGDHHADSPQLPATLDGDLPLWQPGAPPPLESDAQ